jgi:3-oxoacyl-[acyl-carrier-protein] synthase-1
MESRAVADLFGADVAVSSTKPFTGHTLGAAGAVEAAFCWLAMQDDNEEGLLPPHLCCELDPALPALNVARPGAHLGRPIRYALSNSFAFGGSNAALLFGRAA